MTKISARRIGNILYFLITTEVQFVTIGFVSYEAGY